jgi:hypothetical protein
MNPIEVLHQHTPPLQKDAHAKSLNYFSVLRISLMKKMAIIQAVFIAIALTGTFFAPLESKPIVFFCLALCGPAGALAYYSLCTQNLTKDSLNKNGEFREFFESKAANHPEIMPIVLKWIEETRRFGPQERQIVENAYQFILGNAHEKPNQTP